MKLTITSIELKGPLDFFKLSASAQKVVRQLKSSKNQGYKSRGFWKKHYTMTLWNDDIEMREFASSGAHLDAIKISSVIASEIHTITIESEGFPSWKNAKEILKKGKVFKY